MTIDSRDAKTIFLQTIELPANQRTGFLARACGAEPELRRRVEALLLADAEADDFLDNAATPGAIGETSTSEGPGTVIAHYVLQQRLGEGGFGTVWMAEQLHPVRRQVALKIVRHGMDTQSVIARFEQERQTLALMDHANVAKVFDGGETGDGRPYFVMELVQGVPITQFCDQQGLDTNSRLQLFAQVCHAIEHAHHKGVIHRDLKPGNVLVGLHDGEPVAKVIDFGIAKAIHEPPIHAAKLTKARQVLGTPEYMAPEQADLSGHAVDTRTDIYSLGVLLYELLTGSLPFDLRTLEDLGFTEMLRRIREDEPPRPSTRVSTTGSDTAETARRRNTDSRRLQRLLRGDLDWITMKALEKDPARRYGTVQELHADIARHLSHQPVLAGPPDLGYRLRKLLRRRRGQVIAAATVLFTLVLGIYGTARFAIDASRQAATAIARKNEFDQLAATVLYQHAVQSAATLFPATPELIPALESWLADYDVLMARGEVIERTLHDLHSRALPATAAELANDLRQHPDLAAWQDLTKDVAGERRAQQVREGGAPIAVPTLPSATLALPAMILGQQAWIRVAPSPNERTIHGEEPLGLALARAALERPVLGVPRSDLLDTLAWALSCNGLDTEALAASAQCVADAPPTSREQYLGFETSLRQHTEAVSGRKGRDHLREREAALAALDAAVHAQRTFRFTEPGQQFLHDALTELSANLGKLSAGAKRMVEQRLRWARQVADLTNAHPRAHVTWAEAAAAIATADGVVASTAYASHPIKLQPQLGLVPIGMNPQTRLWEFYDLRSAWDGESDPAAIEIPTHASNGSIPVGEATGIIFVLLPGGQVNTGAQSEDANGRNFDAAALHSMGPVKTSMLTPFFLARHEVTQGQWSRLWMGDETLRVPSQFRAGYNLVGNPDPDRVPGNVTFANPVEQVDWPSCDRLLRQHGLELPTEAQWEYACRAGTTTPWSCPQSELVLCANLADATAAHQNADWGGFEAWTDGHVVHAKVGSFRPNGFGMFDMHGNVAEWCSDAYSGFYGPKGERMPGGQCRACCGGAFDSMAAQARSAFRHDPSLILRSGNLGLRAARSLQM